MQTVNGLEEARAALAAGARELASPPYAALHAGVGYYVALLAALQTDYPDLQFTLCCGDDPAVAHEAIRRGIGRVRCAVTPEMEVKLSALALEAGAQFLKG